MGNLLWRSSLKEVLSMSLPKKELLKVSLKRYLERAKGDGVRTWDFFRSP